MLTAQIESEFGDRPPVSMRPESGLWQGYTRPTPAGSAIIRGTLFDPRLLVFTLSGQGLPLQSTLRLTNALRCTLLKEIAEIHRPVAGGADTSGTTFPYPEWLCGHRPDGTPAVDPHIAWAPLPFVGWEHADGHLLGAALILPRGLDPNEVSRLLGPWLHDQVHGLPASIHLFDGDWLEVRAELDWRERPPQSLRPDVWTAERTGACRWASVTPVVLDRHFKGPDKWERAAESVKDACERIGLPRPEAVELHPVSQFRGVPRSDEFPYLSRKRDGGRMHQVHALIELPEPVRGPVLIGAGRFRGYGLCRPLNACNTGRGRGRND